MHAQRNRQERTYVLYDSCPSNTARSPAAPRSTGSRACRSRGRSIPTPAACTVARSVTSGASSSAPTGPPTTATAARQRQAEHRRRASRRARPALLGARGGDDRRRDRSLSAGRGPLPPHPRLHRRARARPHTHLDHHARPDHLARRRRAAGGAPRRRGLGQRLGADARRPRLAHDRAGTAPPRSRLEIVRRLVDAGIRTNVAIAPILPGLSDRPEQLGEAVRSARAGRRAPHLGERPPPPSGHARALSRGARPRLARESGATSGCTRAAATSRQAETAPVATRVARSRASTRATARPALGRRPDTDAAHPRLTRARRIASWPKQPRSPFCSPTTTRSSVKACGSRSSARPTSGSSARPPTARRPSRSRSDAGPT